MIFREDCWCHGDGAEQSDDDDVEADHADDSDGLRFPQRPGIPRPLKYAASAGDASGAL